MKKVLYFLCCCLCACAFVYMCYNTWLGFDSAKHYSFQTILRIITQALGTIGWGFITYGVITRQYAWTEKLCK